MSKTTSKMRCVCLSVFLSWAHPPQKDTGTALLKKERGKSAKRGQTGDFKQDEQPIGERKDRRKGAARVTGCQSVCDTPTLTLESLLAKTPVREHTERTG